MILKYIKKDSSLRGYRLYLLIINVKTFDRLFVCEVSGNQTLLVKHHQLQPNIIVTQEDMLVANAAPI